MVIVGKRSLRREASLLVELLVAMALLTVGLLPLAYSVASERKLARSLYQRAVAMEIVDGEMEVLAAGAWRGFPQGTSVYPVSAVARTNLPPGDFTLTVSGQAVRLEWKPGLKSHGGAVVREFKL